MENNRIRRFNENSELNISDVSDSEKFGFDPDEIGSTDVLSGLSKDVYKAADEYASLEAVNGHWYQEDSSKFTPLIIEDEMPAKVITISRRFGDMKESIDELIAHQAKELKELSETIEPKTPLVISALPHQFGYKKPKNNPKQYWKNGKLRTK